ncbi:hypothetical protein SLS56_004695 [Neofusicoccum ribis]|uniref:Uncharacterized protein n=1 Tax=Neofusicoccum ribis TaxID=45134 RepID=A0ABR3SVS2_9PEZI
MAESTFERKTLYEHPLNMHLIILSSYANHWQAYIEKLATQIGEIRDRVEVVDVKDGPLMPDMLQELRHLEDKVVLRTSASIRSTLSNVELLADVNNKLKEKDANFVDQYAKMEQYLSAYLNRFRTHLNNAEILEKRTQATIGLTISEEDI